MNIELRGRVALWVERESRYLQVNPDQLVEEIVQWACVEKARARSRAVMKGEKRSALEAEVKPSEIVSIRKAARMTQEQFARSVGVTLAAVSQWERGIVTPSADNSVKIRMVHET